MYGTTDMFDYERLRNPRKARRWAVLDRTMHVVTLRAATGTNLPFVAVPVLLGSRYPGCSWR